MPTKPSTKQAERLDLERMDTVVAIHTHLSPALDAHPLIRRWRRQAQEYRRVVGQFPPPLVLRFDA